MQVFTGEMGEYHRTRLTHTFEVASVARTIGRVLRLNEDLIEGLALMHDIGHPPYGHCGEDVLDECLKAHGGFSHNRFALTIVEVLEERYGDFPGLNLSAEVLAGQQTRANKKGAANAVTAPLLEVQVVDAADSMAYDAHDVDDALQLGLLTLDELKSLGIVRRAWEKVEDRWQHLSPGRFRPALVHELIDLQVSDFVQTAQQALVPWQGERALELCQQDVRLNHSDTLAQERQELERFLFDRVYRHPRLMKVRQAAEQRLRELFLTLTKLPDRLPLRFRVRSQVVSVPVAVGEYLAGMTDRFCDAQYYLLLSGDGPLADW
jgi:dGTPase